MRVVELGHLDALEALRGPWRDLASRATHDTPYLLPEFLLPWVRRLDARYRPRFLAAWHDDRLVGLAPMVERRIGRAGIQLRFLAFPEVVPSPPCDLLVDAHERGVVDAFFTHWMGRDDWDVIDMANVPVESDAVRRLAELAQRAGLRVCAVPEMETYVLPISGAWDDYLATRGANLRRTLRRGRKRLEGEGAVRFSAFPGEMTQVQAFEMAMDVISRSWKDHEGGPDSWNAFVRALLVELHRVGTVRLSFLLVAERAVAYLLEVPCKGSVFALHSAYDLATQAGDPGQLMLAHAIERAHREGVRTYDFTGDKDYLRRWTTQTRRFARTRITRPNPFVRLKLRAYDWLRARRVREVLASTDGVKDAKKLAGAAAPSGDD